MATRKNLSGVRLLASGEEALDSLIALADHAERTLDIQYYIIHQDESARDAARSRPQRRRSRRARARAGGRSQYGGRGPAFPASRASTPNVEVRVFNPFPGGRSATWSRILTSISDIPRINHRMHNKLFVADNELAITGGRNIGDEYFTLDKHSNFIDLDVVAAGPIVPQLSASFDAFWNSKYAYPDRLAGRRRATRAERRRRQPPPRSADRRERRRRIGWRRELDAQDAPARSGCPRRCSPIGPPRSRARHRPTKRRRSPTTSRRCMRSAQHELMVISPYFVPGEGGCGADARAGRPRRAHPHTHQLARLHRCAPGAQRLCALPRGAARWASSSPRCGRSSARSARAFIRFKSSNASLHAKALVIDQRTVFIGSLNMDGRSARFNSELGLVMRSPEIARQVTSLLDDISADGSYKLSLDAARPHRVVERRRRAREDLAHGSGDHAVAALRLEAARAVRAGGAAVSEPTRPGRLSVMRMVRGNPYLGAKSLAARHRGAAGEHQDEIAAQGAVHLAQVVHVDQAGAADPQHGLGPQRLLGLAQGAAGMIAVPARPG